ncbi:MAG: YggT family protein [Gammaproteobacteria bacterium]|nr:YggT family protein [Gammaproteobacteria bacterium]NNC66552.1 YggT family protein [Gammaproteobacteria bacterium]
MNALLDVINYLFHIVVTLYIYAVIIRMLLGLTRADFYNPFSQFILTITNPILTPLRKFIPSIGKVDSSAIALIFILKFAELAINNLLVGKGAISGSLVIPVIFSLANQLINIYLLAIFILVVISWLAPFLQGQSNPIASVLHSITAPIMDPVRKLIPPVGIFDLSTFVVFLALLALKRFLWHLHYMPI